LQTLGSAEEIKKPLDRTHRAYPDEDWQPFLDFAEYHLKK
jgi:hypothetical protein